MKIVIETVPHNKQPYDTAGEYWRDGAGTLHIQVSETGDDWFNSLIGLHEWVEVMLMERRGIKLIDSNNFDIPFEKERAEGKHGPNDEPGDDPRCPYQNEHLMASGVEQIVCSALGIKWKDYGEAVGKLDYAAD